MKRLYNTFRLAASASKQQKRHIQPSYTRLVAFIIIVSLILCSVQMHATDEKSNKNNDGYGHIELELGIGPLFGMQKLGFDRINTGANFYIEPRYVFSDVPVSVGFNVAAMIFHRESDNAGRQRFKSWNFMAVGDYQLARSKNISVFAGMGLGFAKLDVTAPVIFDNSQPNWGGFITGDSKNVFSFMPRVSIEMFKRFRLTTSLRIEEKSNNNLSVTIGYIFGGRAHR